MYEEISQRVYLISRWSFYRHRRRRRTFAYPLVSSAAVWKLKVAIYSMGCHVIIHRAVLANGIFGSVQPSSFVYRIIIINVRSHMIERVMNEQGLGKGKISSCSPYLLKSGVQSQNIHQYHDICCKLAPTSNSKSVTRAMIWNANGLLQRKLELDCFLLLHKVDIALISETYCTSRFSLTKVRDYRVYNTFHPSG